MKLTKEKAGGLIREFLGKLSKKAVFFEFIMVIINFTFLYGLYAVYIGDYTEASRMTADALAYYQILPLISIIFLKGWAASSYALVYLSSALALFRCAIALCLLIRKKKMPFLVILIVFNFIDLLITLVAIIAPDVFFVSPEYSTAASGLFPCIVQLFLFTYYAVTQIKTKKQLQSVTISASDREGAV